MKERKLSEGVVSKEKQGTTTILLRTAHPKLDLQRLRNIQEMNRKPEEIQNRIYSL